MLDALSNGRFQLGVGRGVSPIELGFHGLDMAEQRGRYDETLEVLLKGSSSDGARLPRASSTASTRCRWPLRPVQRPHPPLWYGAGSPDSIRWCAQNGVNMVTLALGERVRQATDLYRAEWQGAPEAMPLIGRQPPRGRRRRATPKRWPWPARPMPAGAAAWPSCGRSAATAFPLAGHLPTRMGLRPTRWATAAPVRPKRCAHSSRARPNGRVQLLRLGADVRRLAARGRGAARRSCSPQHVAGPSPQSLSADVTFGSASARMSTPRARAVRRRLLIAAGIAAALAIAAIPLGALLAQIAGRAYTVIETGQGYATLATGGRRDRRRQWHDRHRLRPPRRLRGADRGRGILPGQPSPARRCSTAGPARARRRWCCAGAAAEVSGLVFQNMRVPDFNGAGIRLEKGDLTVAAELVPRQPAGHPHRRRRPCADPDRPVDLHPARHLRRPRRLRAFDLHRRVRPPAGDPQPVRGRPRRALR